MDRAPRAANDDARLASGPAAPDAGAQAGSECLQGIASLSAICNNSKGLVALPSTGVGPFLTGTDRGVGERDSLGGQGRADTVSAVAGASVSDAAAGSPG